MEEENVRKVKDKDCFVLVRSGKGSHQKARIDDSDEVIYVLRSFASRMVPLHYVHLEIVVYYNIAIVYRINFPICPFTFYSSFGFSIFNFTFLSLI